MVRHRVVKDDLRSVEKKKKNNRDGEIESNTCKGIEGNVCCVNMRDMRPERFIRMLFGPWYTISWKNISPANVLLSIPRRVCRARVSRSNSQG